jgi:DNA-binding response OmpR family regulator
MTRILLIDDDPLITDPLSRTLSEKGYQVAVAGDGVGGLKLALETHPDVVVLDIMLPEMDGWDVCRTLRARSAVPILMLTALGEEVDRILGLEIGADDYLAKPFSARELLVRIKALLRRVELDRAVDPAQLLSNGDVKLHLQSRTVSKAGKPLDMRYKEFELLSLLMANAGHVLSRTDIFDRVWGTDWIGDTRTLDVHIRWLREKIETDPAKPQYIQTVRGVGYRFTPPEEHAA